MFIERCHDVREREKAMRDVVVVLFEVRRREREKREENERTKLNSINKWRMSSRGYSMNERAKRTNERSEDEGKYLYIFLAGID